MRNPLVKELVRLQGARARRESGLILVEGPQLVREVVAGGIPIETGLTTDPSTYPDAVVVPEHVLQRVSTTATANAVVVAAHRPEREPRPGGDLVVLCDVSEPGNVGALIRSAAAFGFDVVVAGDRSADPWSPKALRAGAGGHFHTSVQMSAGFDPVSFETAGYVPIATVPRDGDEHERPEGRVALLIGSEAHGLPAQVIERATLRWSIPTLGVESLNASVAGALAMYAHSRGR